MRHRPGQPAEATLELAASRAEAFPGQRAYLEAEKSIQRAI